MASAVTSQKFWSIVSGAIYDHDPGATTAVITSADGGTTKRVVAMADYGVFAVMVMPTVASSDLILLEIVGCTDSSGSNPTVVVASAADLAADAPLVDFAVLECTAAQVNEVGRAAGLALTHIAARLTMTNAGDEAVVVYLRAFPRFGQLNKTVNVIS